MKSKKVLLLISVLLFTALLLSGCSFIKGLVRDTAKDTILGEEEKEAGDVDEAEISEAREKETEDESAELSESQWNQLMTGQARAVFAIAFTGGGFSIEVNDYEEGEYTVFEWKNDGEESIFLEKAYLKKLDDGKQWWRIKWYDEEISFLYEALLDPVNQQLLRLRAKDADGRTGEIPVSGQALYIPPARVTRESLEGASAGSESLTVSAGTFQCEHIIYSEPSGAGSLEWWITEKVPGGIVKQLWKEREKELVWSISLQEYGTGSNTVLNSY